MNHRLTTNAVSKRLRCLRSACAGLFVALTSAGHAVPIDPLFPASDPAPLSIPIAFQFRTSWDGITWASEQKIAVREALDYLGRFFVDGPGFVELASPDDFTLRWAGNDLFRDWGDDADLSDALGFAFKVDLPPQPWDDPKYPRNEIYFNSSVKWHYSPFTEPSPDEYDFPSVILHETIHMLGVNGHSSDPAEVMFSGIGRGERRFTVKQSDLDLLTQAQYSMHPEDFFIRPAIPEPPISSLALSGLVVIICFGAGKRFREPSTTSIARAPRSSIGKIAA